MTMTGSNSDLKDEVGKLVDDSLPPNGPGMVEQMFQAVKNLIIPTHKELITQIRQGTPIKVSKSIAISAGGVIGGGVTNPTFDQVIYQAPESAEAWLHRITITSPGHGGGSPIVSPAELILIGSTAGEIILSLPEIVSTEVVAPSQFIEGRYSAPHLDRGEQLCVNGDALPANGSIRFDLQIILVTGASEFTPRSMSPSDLTRQGAPNAI